MKEINEANTYLESNIPRSEIYVRPGAGGKTLSYFEVWWVNQLLNQAFGNTGWDNETLEMQLIPGTTLPTYRAKTRIRATVRVGDNAHFSIQHDGYGIGTGKNAEDHEMALKSAESDSFKRAAMKFGKRLGLALYDKSEEFITDDSKDKIGSATTQPAGSNSQSPQASTNQQVQPKVSVGVGSPKTAKASSGPGNPRDALNSLIRSTAQVAFSKKILVDGAAFDLSAMKAWLGAYGVEQTDQLTDPQAHEVLERLKFLIN